MKKTLKLIFVAVLILLAAYSRELYAYDVLVLKQCDLVSLVIGKTI